MTNSLNQPHIFDSIDALKACLATRAAWSANRIETLEARLTKRRESYSEINWTGQIEISADDLDSTAGVIPCHTTMGKMILMPAKGFARETQHEKI